MRRRTPATRSASTMSADYRRQTWSGGRRQFAQAFGRIRVRIPHADLPKRGGRPRPWGVMPRITLVEGDLTTEPVDVVVNAANSSLLGGGGVDGAIHRRGGPEILEACKELRATSLPEGLPTGQAVATTAGRLAARWVVHTVGPVYAKREDRSGLLAACHVESLRVADELGARTVAFPAISCGIYGYPLEEAAPVAVASVRQADTRVEEVRFVLRGAEAVAAWERALAR
jgi:O-acetyl-ADP-ribose deacetylase (regulator of RNase III)